jgi:hypothetical protein
MDCRRVLVFYVIEDFDTFITPLSLISARRIFLSTCFAAIKNYERLLNLPGVCFCHYNKNIACLFKKRPKSETQRRPSYEFIRDLYIRYYKLPVSKPWRGNDNVKRRNILDSFVDQVRYISHRVARNDELVAAAYDYLSEWVWDAIAFTLDKYYYFPDPLVASVYMKQLYPDYCGTRELTVFINGPSVYRLMHIFMGTTIGEFKEYFWAKFDSMPQPLNIQESIHMYASFTASDSSRPSKEILDMMEGKHPDDIQPRTLQVYFGRRQVLDHEIPKYLYMRKSEQIFVLCNFSKQ